jgi:hypothetical protein
VPWKNGSDTVSEIKNNTEQAKTFGGTGEPIFKCFYEVSHLSNVSG